MALTAFSNELSDAWRVFRSQWRTAVKIAVVPVVPLLLTVPFLIERAILLTSGETTVPLPTSFLTVAVGLLGVAGFIVVSFVSKAALTVAFYRSPRLDVRRSLALGLQRFPAFFTTELLVAILIGITMLLPLSFLAWYDIVRRLAISDFSTLVATDAVILLGTLALFLPAILLAVWLEFAALAVAVGDANGPVAALQRSVHLVRGRAVRLLKRLAGWVALSLVLTIAVAPLPIANWLTPFLLTLYGTAFLVVLYKELRGS